jgi:hypothetical protein
VATFEIAYRLCSQILSLVITPLLGVSAASALLSRRQTDLEKVLKPFLGYTLSLLLPLALFFESFAAPLVGTWLGPEGLGVGALLPKMFIAFAIYYATETLYKAIEGSGLSSYSAAIQTASLIVNLSVFLLLESYSQTLSVSLSMLAGFLLFSVGNALVFTRRFQTIHLFDPTIVGWLLLPSCAYVLLQLVVPRELLPVCFTAYVIGHVWCLRGARIFNAVGFARMVWVWRRSP